MTNEVPGTPGPEKDAENKKSWASKILGFNPGKKLLLAKDIVAGALVVTGIISNIVSWTGGLFVASGFVLAFYAEMRRAFLNLKEVYLTNGPIKNAIICAVMLFFGIKMTSFTMFFLILCAVILFVSGKGDESENLSEGDGQDSSNNM